MTVSGVSMAGRPSNRDERYEQVMQAFVRCVARVGLDGATLNEIAKEAGLTRPLIRHHLGNRDEMIRALRDYVINGFDLSTDQLIEALPDGDPVPALVDLLFSEQANTSPDLILAFAALTARASEDESLRGDFRASILGFEAQIADVLRRTRIDVSMKDAQVAAHGVVALYFNTASLAALDMPKDWRNLSINLAHSLCADMGGRHGR